MMKQEYTATKPRFNETLTFAHDPDAGKITGPDAKIVREYLRRWDGVALLYGGTQVEPAPDPMGSSRDMAIMLFEHNWDLPAELSDLLPPAQSIPEGAVA